MSTHVRRRSVLGSVGGAIAVALAGCSDGGNGDGDDGDEGDDGTTADGTDAPSTTAPSTTAPPTTATTAEGDELTIDEFLADTSNYDGIEDLTGSESVAVDVGAEGNGAAFAFAPAAIRVDAGTTVTWTWTGQGGTHNVAAVQGADFTSEQTDAEGTTFEQVFESAGTVLYECVPHTGAGMRGAVVVE